MVPRSSNRLAEDKRAKFWRELGLLPGAPDCVIKAAHRYLIEIHHPDRGGSDKKAKAVNVARDEVAGEGMPANEYVAHNYTGEPWHVLGLMANAERDLVERTGRALTSELKTNRRLVERVEWAIENFGKPTNGARPSPLPKQPPQRNARADRPPEKRPRAAAGKPEGLVERVDFGTLEWGSTTVRELKLTWREFPPFSIRVKPTAPILAEIKESRALPGRFVIRLSVHWAAIDTQRATSPSLRLNVPIDIEWASGGHATLLVIAVLRLPMRTEPSPAQVPAHVIVKPDKLDFGEVSRGDGSRCSLFLTANIDLTIVTECSAWLRRTDHAGKALDRPIRLMANRLTRIWFCIEWIPIERRIPHTTNRLVRPTGKVSLRWRGGEIEIPAQVVVRVR